MAAPAAVTAGAGATAGSGTDGEAEGAEHVQARAHGSIGGGQRRRNPKDPVVQEVIDELAQETKRTALLDRVEAQLKGVPHVSRLLFAFNIADDRKAQIAVESEFSAWREKQENNGEDLTGFLLFIQQTSIHFLEGPTELLFKAVELFNTLAQDIPAPPASATTGEKSSTTAAPAARPALISMLRVVYFTELHGVRASRGWCGYAHAGKLQGGTQVQLEDSNCPEIVFMTYKKVLMLCLKVRENTREDEVISDKLQVHYKKLAEMFPSLDELSLLLGKLAAEFLFTYPEFEKVFIAPFRVVLHSELLWPMPPALSY